jgi:hypothetical protein
MPAMISDFANSGRFLSFMVLFYITQTGSQHISCIFIKLFYIEATLRAGCASYVTPDSHCQLPPCPLGRSNLNPRWSARARFVFVMPTLLAHNVGPGCNRGQLRFNAPHQIIHFLIKVRFPSFLHSFILSCSISPIATG